MFKNHRFSTISNQVNPTLKCFRLMFDVSRCLKKKSQDICIAENIEVESNKESKNHKARKCYFASASTVCGAEAPAEAISASTC
jgi:hypothetical protein